MKKRWITISLITIVLLSACSNLPALKPGNQVGGQSPEGITVKGSSNTPITVTLSMPFAPAVDKDVLVTFAVSSTQDLPGTQVVLVIPETAELLSAQTEWTLDLLAGKTESVQATIRFNSAGEYSIEGYALKDLGGGTVWGDSAAIFLTVGQYSSKFGWGVPGVNQNASPSGEVPNNDDTGAAGSGSCGKYDDCYIPTGQDSVCPLSTSDPATPISVDMKLPQDIRTNVQTELLFTVCSISEAPGTRANIILPSSVELMSGEDTWVVDLSANQPIVFTITIRFTRIGPFMLSGHASYDLGGGTVWGDQKDIFVTINN